MDKYDAEELSWMLKDMQHSKIGNYIVPGLKSYLIGGSPSEGTGWHGRVRLFESTMHQDMFITPHSHRYPFFCIVLDGEVVNTTFDEADNSDEKTEVFHKRTVYYAGSCGHFVPEDYSLEKMNPVRVKRNSRTYRKAAAYSMSSDAIHSIKFSDGARVLFFEGPAVTDSSNVLLPIFEGKIIDTLERKPWMFTT